MHLFNKKTSCNYTSWKSLKYYIMLYNNLLLSELFTGSKLAANLIYLLLVTKSASGLVFLAPTSGRQQTR